MGFEEDLAREALMASDNDITRAVVYIEAAQAAPPEETPVSPPSGGDMAASPPETAPAAPGDPVEPAPASPPEATQPAPPSEPRQGSGGRPRRSKSPGSRAKEP